MKHLSDLIRNIKYSDEAFIIHIPDISINTEKNKIEGEKSKLISDKEKIENLNNIIKKKDIETEGLKKSQEAKTKEHYSRGFEEGKKEGLKFAEELAQKKIKDINSFIKNLTDAFKSHQEELVISSESEVLNLSLTIAEKIIKNKIEIDNSIVSNNIRETLKRVGKIDKIIIRINSEDYRDLKDKHKDFLKEFIDIREIEIIEDIGVEKGGCIVSSESGIFDSRIKTQLANIKREINNVRPV